MALKFKCKAKDEIPVELHSLYLERDGSFVLDVDGAVDKARGDEVRATNIALTSQLAEQEKRFEAIESEQVKAIAAERDSLNAKLTAIQVDQGVLTVATKKGLRPTAIPDITARARVVLSGGEKYLPQLNSQSDEKFLAYRRRASFFNATVRTAEGFKTNDSNHPLSVAPGSEAEAIIAHPRGRDGDGVERRSCLYVGECGGETG
jgi:hypothetical protein